MEFNLEIIKKSYGVFKVNYRQDQGKRYFVYGYKHDEEEWDFDDGDLLMVLNETEQINELKRNFTIFFNNEWLCKTCFKHKKVESLKAEGRQHWGWTAWEGLPNNLMKEFQNKILVEVPELSWKNVKRLDDHNSNCFIDFNICTDCMTEDEYKKTFTDIIKLLKLWELELATKAILEGNEKVLEGYIAHNIEIVETDMKLIDTQVKVKEGIIDILAKDKNGITCIIELKVRTNDKNLIWQSAYYQSEIEEDVRVITIAPSYEDVISKALLNVKNIEMKIFNLDDKGLLQIENFEPNQTVKLSEKLSLLANEEQDKAI
ncbi:endonuclease NucS [Halalkalibacterium halodurans]|uniref:endonuclease NucS domain-containing protein n=1 Tax=Halalkalibacterium halodurans TaxID=86665 RepID=UPI002E232E45|nr:endonuclease NucS domain-containing protein [Halalkalibacterium halodurans]MED3648796.1 endonuclease NucS [Halalkalibacterium halodurans]